MSLQRLKRKLEFLRRTPLHPQWLIGGQNRILRLIKRYAHGKTLDIGCADRWVEQHLPQDSRYVGLDYLPTSKMMYGTRPEVYANASDLPFLEDNFDCVILLEVLEHLPTPDRALAEIRRVLKPGGYLVLSIPFLYPIHDAPFDFQRLTRHGLVSRLVANGMQIDHIERTNGTLETVGLLCNIGLVGTVLTSMKQRHPTLILAPLVLAFIPVINIIAWSSGKLFPSWEPLTAGYQVVARRPDSAERSA